MTSCVSSLKNTVNLHDLTANAIDFASSNGILMKAKISPTEKACIHLPFTLFPSPVPKDAFHLLKDIQPHINKMMHLLSKDTEFLLSSLKNVIESDEFTRKLAEILNHTSNLPTRSKHELGIFRSDYMFHSTTKPDGSLCHVPKQIEINTISASFAGLSQVMRSVHSRVLSEAEQESQIPFLPENLARSGIARGFISAWQAYGSPNAVLVFLVQGNERNIYDQRGLEYEINRLNPNVCVRRKTFNDVITDGVVMDDGSLFIGKEEIALVYFRVGYSPDQYETEQYWDARLIIEKSRAIKSPSVAHQLIGCKKMQEVLARPGVVERYIKDPTIAEKIRSTFAGLYSLDLIASGEDAVKLAMNNPDDFVLKPQREGGGNNLYGNDIIKCLRETCCDQRRCSYILMEKIRPRPHENYILSFGKMQKAETVSELGIYGVFLTNEMELIENYTAGHLLRSKSIEHDDGGVAAGVAVLDSPLLV